MLYLALMRLVEEMISCIVNQIKERLGQSNLQSCQLLILKFFPSGYSSWPQPVLTLSNPLLLQNNRSKFLLSVDVITNYNIHSFWHQFLLVKKERKFLALNFGMFKPRRRVLVLGQGFLFVFLGIFEVLSGVTTGTKDRN